jgi:hypothetical protein
MQVRATSQSNRRLEEACNWSYLPPLHNLSYNCPAFLPPSPRGEYLQALNSTPNTPNLTMLFCTRINNDPCYFLARRPYEHAFTGPSVHNLQLTTDRSTPSDLGGCAARLATHQYQRKEVEEDKT